MTGSMISRLNRLEGRSGGGAMLLVAASEDEAEELLAEAIANGNARPFVLVGDAPVGKFRGVCAALLSCWHMLLNMDAKYTRRGSDAPIRKAVGAMPLGTRS